MSRRKASRASLAGGWMAALLVAAMAAFWLLTADFDLIDRLQFGSGIPAGPLAPGTEVTQTFAPAAGSIDRVDLALNKQGAGGAGTIDLSLAEVDGTDAGGAPFPSEPLRTVGLDAGSFDYGAIRRFEFEPAALDPGREYAFTLTGAGAGAGEVTAGGSQRDNYSGGALFVSGKKQEGDLYFALYHGADASGMLAKLEPWRPFPLASAVLLTALFLTGAAAFGWLVWMIAHGAGAARPD
jgi:hypothetical protein